MSEKRTEGEEIAAWRVREGDRILMPDDVTWCTINRITREPDTGLLFMTFVELGFARKKPDAIVQVQRAITP